jgi:hypothetical protein
MSSGVNPNVEFAVVFNNFLLQTNKVIAFRNDALFLIENGKEQLLSKAKQKIQAVKDFSNSGKTTIEVTPEVEKIFGESLDAFQFVKYPHISIRHSKRRIDAAAIVFIHSLLDATIYSLCKISHSLNPNDWMPFIKDRKIEIGTVLAETKDNVIQAATEKFLVGLERESIVKRSDILHAICKPASQARYANNFTFSKSALETFDNLRHDIVHGQQSVREIFTIDQELNFGLKAGVYFSSMIRHKYGLEKEISEQQYEQLVAEN